jgi:uncharacterized protein (UPF0276 family)
LEWPNTVTPNLEIPSSAGVGLRLPHIQEVAATRPAVAWLEIHPENFLANPHAAELLKELSDHYPISFHTVGISIGSVTGIDRNHLKRMRTLMDMVNPALVSGHLAWSTYRGDYLNDLLPIPYNRETLRVIRDHLKEVQDELGRAYLVENPSTYVGFTSSTMSESEFLAELVYHTDSRLLCDVSNIQVSAHNMGYDAYQYLDALPADSIVELHLGGYTPEPDETNPGFELLIDTHAAAISPASWDLYAYAIRRFGPRPTLIEWDDNLPELRTLLGEAIRADKIAGQAMPLEAGCADPV